MDIERVEVLMKRFNLSFLTEDDRKEKYDWYEHFNVIDNDGYKYRMRIPALSYYKSKKLEIARPENNFSFYNMQRYLVLNKKPYELIIDDYNAKYKGKHQKLKAICKEKGHVFESTWGRLKNGKVCPRCSKKYHDADSFIEVVKEKYGDEYTVLGEYIDSCTKISIRHNVCGTVWDARPATFVATKPKKCPKYECCLHYGENNHRWNPLLTDEEREENNSRTGTLEYGEWRNKVLRINNFTCDACGTRSNIIAHHLNGWNLFPDERYSIENGIPLCEACHQKFHNLYGFGNNTKEQYIEFKNNLDNTEINEEISKGFSSS